jgi:hypothetical protein
MEHRTIQAPDIAINSPFTFFCILLWWDNVVYNIANLRYPAKNDKFFAGERRYSHENTKRLVGIKVSM